MNIRRLQPAGAGLPTTLPGDGSPSSLIAVLDTAQVQIAALETVSNHSHARLLHDVQDTEINPSEEATRDAWHNQFIRPQWIRAEAILTRLLEYHEQLQGLPEILPAWSAAIARLEQLVARVNDLHILLEVRINEVFDAEADRRRAAGLPFRSGENAQ